MIDCERWARARAAAIVAVALTALFAAGCDDNACDNPGTGECAPQDAEGDGSCEAIIGAMWDGCVCKTISGCNCDGDDCDALYSDEVACRADRASCLGLDRCAGPDGSQCSADMYCRMPSSTGYPLTGCGDPGAFGICTPRPTDCSTAEPQTNCGCDGNTYSSYCEANMAGTDIAHGGSC